MPDWSYRTVFRPLLSALPWPAARKLAFGFMGALNRQHGGGAVINFLGHLHPDSRMSCRLGDDVRVRSPLGLSPALDVDALATGALARFGFGFIELGPLVLPGTSRPSQQTNGSESRWSVRNEEIVIGPEAVGLSIDVLERAAAEAGASGVAVFVRWPRPGDVIDSALPRWSEVLTRAARCATALSIPSQWFTSSEASVREIGLRWSREARELCVPLVLAVVAGDESESESQGLVQRLQDGTLDGILIDVPQTSAGGWHLSRAAFLPALAATKRWRALVAGEIPIIVSGGIHEPGQAVELLDAGATALQLDSGLAFSGPGLPKRINETLLSRRLAESDRVQATRRPGCVSSDDAGRSDSRAASMAWLWTMLIGLSLLGGGLLVLSLGLTRVVLPYDEAMTGINRQQLAGINPRLLPFMIHDRVTLAGTMLALGTLYVALAWCGVRRGIEWARSAVVWSSLAGFFSFFTFLGFGYFDALHAFVSGILLQFTLLAMHSPMSPRRVATSDLTNDRAWVSSQWGQLLFVMHAVALIVAGLVICAVGSTSVFVREDLEFLNTTAEELCGANPSLVPLVAHDRATFGGMLLSCGITVLLITLWGFQRRQRWLWWSLLLSGSVGYLGTLAVHWFVGYGSLFHLIPAYVGLASVWLGCGLSRGYLLDGNSALFAPPRCNA